MHAEVLAVLLASATQAPPVSEVAVSCAATEIRIAIRNPSPAPVDVDAGALPWSFQSSSTLIRTFLVGDGASTEVAVLQLPANNFGEVAMAPGARLEGSFSLVDRLDDYDGLRQKGQLLVLVAIDEERFSREPGARIRRWIVLIPRVGGECPSVTELD
jgi:hypothetical protein